MAVAGKTSVMVGHANIEGQSDEAIVAENYQSAYGITLDTALRYKHALSGEME
jgi:hypothetical protein